MTADRPEREPPSLALSAAPWVAPSAAPWERVAAPGRKARMQIAASPTAVTMTNARRSTCAARVPNFSFHCPLRFSATPRRGLQMPTIDQNGARPRARPRAGAGWVPRQQKAFGRLFRPGTPSRAAKHRRAGKRPRRIWSCLGRYRVGAAGWPSSFLRASSARF